MDSYVTTLNNRFALRGTPVFNSKFCMNASSFKTDCRVCVDACHESIYEDKRQKKPDYAKCIKCGMCSAICPSHAITPIDSRTRAFMVALGRRDVISVGCSKDDDSWTISLECVAAMSWEQAACAAINSGIVISTRKCSECEDETCLAAVQSLLDSLKLFLGADFYSERVKVLSADDDYVPAGNSMSRRDLLTFFNHLPLSVAVDLLPEMAPTDNKALFYRAVLRDFVKKSYDETEADKRRKYVVRLPRFTDRCYDCELCQRMCPEKAIKLIPSEDKSEFSITVQAWKCTACGVCVNLCREKCINGIVKMSVPHLGAILIRRNKSNVCVQCGKVCPPGSPEGLCSLCYSKKQSEEKRASLKRQKEAREAAAAAKAAEDEKAADSVDITQSEGVADNDGKGENVL